MKKLLIIEDEADLAHILKSQIVMKSDAIVEICPRGDLALEFVDEFKPNLILLDLMLPGKGGVQICQELREKFSSKDLGIIMLTAMSSEENVIKGLDAGADDYVTKPFNLNVLLARVNSAFRRLKSHEDKKNEGIFKIGELCLDVTRHKVWVEEQEVELTATEFSILRLLMSSPGAVFTRARIVSSIRGDNHAVTDRAVDFQMVGLRKKIGSYGQHVETVRGVGYRFKE